MVCGSENACLNLGWMEFKKMVSIRGTDMTDKLTGLSEVLCKHCGGLKAVRNPTGYCDHLYWPDMLADEAKRANGFRLTTRKVWEKVPPHPYH